MMKISARWSVTNVIRLNSLMISSVLVAKGETMSDDLISRKALLKAMDTWDKFGFSHGAFVREPENDDYIPYVHYADMVICVEGMPPAQPERKKGKWIAVKVGNGETRYTCSECGVSYQADSRDEWAFLFCPKCGAQMAEVKP